jgi:hypothetical protein
VVVRAEWRLECRLPAALPDFLHARSPTRTRQEIPMPEAASHTLSQQARLPSDESQSITFRPQRPGEVFIQSTPPPASARTETGLLAGIALHRPGLNAPLRSLRYPRDSQSLSIAYTATEADLATPGDWTAVVTNDTLTPQTFATDVTYPISNPVMSASVDIGLLNLILSKLFDAASITGHIESSDRPELQLSHVALSPDVAGLLKQASFTSFHVGDVTSHGIGYRIKRIDTDPATPIMAITTDPLALIVTIRIDPASVKLEALGPLPLPGLRVGAFSVELQVGFEGSVRTSCHADVHLTLDNLDLSEALSSGVVDGINGLIHGDARFAALFSPNALRGYIDLFFKSFMRLDSRATDLSYTVRDQALVVSYLLS